MRRGVKIGIGIWLAGALVVTGAGIWQSDGTTLGSLKFVHAAPQETMQPTSEPQTAGESSAYQGQLDAAEQKKEELKKEQEKIENKLDNIQEFVSDVAKYVRTLDMQMGNLLESIDSNKEEMKQVQEEIEAVDQEYENAKSKQEEQYEGMKAHIKYMYENSDSNYLVYLMKSRSLADFLSREEYVEKVTNYDKVLLTQYQGVLDEIAAAQQRAEEKKKEIAAKKTTLKYEKKKMNQLSEEKTRQIKVYQGLVDENKDMAADYAAQIAEQEKEIENLLKENRETITQQESEGDTVQVVPTTGEYAWPLPVSGHISSTFGPRHAPTAGASTYHKGVDIAVDSGTNVLACKEGKVVTATYSSSAGNFISIYHGGGIYSYYMHCSQLKTSVGKRVKKGQVIAKSGSTGISTGPHLHFAMFKSGNYVNPMYYVKQP